jgi:tetratricopeptide (TPR) repeat protein
MKRINLTIGLACFWTVLALAAPADAQEITWRYDYAKARQEAAETGRLLLLDFITDQCFWCKQLDARTFRDPEIVQLVTTRCVALKVDANQFPQLAQALNVQKYPTLVIAGPDSRIHGFQEGFVEPGPLKEQLQRILATIGEPEWMVRDFRDAQQAQAAADYARAVLLLRRILDDGKDRPVQQKARVALAELEQQATGRLSEGRHLVDRGQPEQAVKVVGELCKLYKGTAAAREGEQFLLTILRKNTETNEGLRQRQARELLVRAKEDYKSQQFLCCLDRCEVLATEYAEMPEAREAMQLASEIKSNPEWTKQAADQLSERLGLLYLSLAETWLRKGQPQQAIFYLERVTQTFPNTRQAELATSRLAQIKGPPTTTPVDYKKQN